MVFIKLKVKLYKYLFNSIIMELLPIRRFVDADNSCLFSSIAYLLNKDNFNENSSLMYRLMIVDHINSTDIGEDMLGMSKTEYIEKISQTSTWGGAIELKFFSEIFNVQIASIDVQSGRLDVFGEMEDYEKRIYMLYNGIHYDPLVMNNTDDIASDITIFSPEDNEKMIMFKDYVESIKAKGDFVDTSNINNLKCEVCDTEFFSEEEAVVHGSSLGHWNFKQL